MMLTVAGAWCTAHEPWGQRFGGLAQQTQKARGFRSHTTTHKTYTGMCACTLCLYSLYVLDVYIGGGTCARAADAVIAVGRQSEASYSATPVLQRSSNASIQMTLGSSIDKPTPPR